jgi:hypothetical protein
MYYQNCFNKFHSDIKKTWQVIKEVISKEEKTENYPDYFIINDNYVSDPSHISMGNYLDSVTLIVTRDR